MSDSPVSGSSSPLITYGGNESTIVIPCDPKDFGGFISSLLGKPQSIDRRIKGPYEVNKDDIRNLHALVIQRVLIQNNASITYFTTLASYSDGSSVRLNSLEDFLSYAEIKPLISTDLSLEWSFLVEFPGRKIPEKQQIGVSFITFREYEDDSTVIDHSYMARYAPDSIILKISHTDRTWGADLENLISNHLRGLLTPDSKWRKTIQRRANLIGIALGAIVIIGSLYAVSSAVKRTTDYLSAFSPTNPLSEIETLRILLEFSKSGVWDQFTLYSIGFVVVGIMAGMIVGSFATSSIERTKRSYVLLTKKSEEQRDRDLKSRSRGIYYLLGCALLTVLLGVISNYVFSFSLRVWS